MPLISLEEQIYRCSLCKKEKSFSEFQKQSSAPQGIRCSCRECINKNSRENRRPLTLDEKEKRKEYYKIYRNLEGKKDRKRHIDLQYKFSISLEQYNKILEEQNHCCAICKKHESEFKLSLALDHCHVTGKIRGILCSKCNTGLGMFNDNLNLFNEAKNYLIKYK